MFPLIKHYFFSIFYTFGVVLMVNVAANGENDAHLSSAPICHLCNCLRSTVICSCLNKNSSLFLNGTLFEDRQNNLQSISSIRNLRSLVVHDCPFVSIATDTFSALRITEQLKFVDVRRLVISPYSFRKILRAPKQIVIQNAQVDYVPSFAFTGISHVPHFWWRNVTILRLGRLAFAKIANIEYLYFREVRIQKLESEAFAWMHQIGHFYLRGSVSLDHVGDNLFIGSRCDEIFLEDVKAPRENLNFGGLVAKTVRISNSTWNLIKNPSNPALGLSTSRPIPRQRIHEIHIRKCSIFSIHLFAFLNTSLVLIEDSHIKHLYGKSSSSEASTHAGKWPQTIKFVGNKINRWHSGAIWSRLQKISAIDVSNCSIGHLCTGAIHSSRIGGVHFSGGKIGRIYPGAFSANRIDTFTFDGTFIYRLGTSAFAHSKILGSMSMKNVHFGTIESHSFARVNVAKMSLDSCIVDHILNFTFTNLTVASLDIRNTIFHSALDISVFSDLTVTERFVFSNCQLSCLLNDCEMNALFTRSSVHNNLIWKFSDNICLLPAKINHAVIVARSVEVNVGNGGIHDNLMYYSQNEEEDMCNKESITNWQNNRIQCRRRMIIEECVCSDVPMTGNEDPIKVPKTSTMMLLIGDCQQRLLLDLVSDPTTVIMPVTEQSIYLYRLNELRIRSVPPWIRRIHVLHSRIIIDGPHAFYGTHIRELAFHDSIIESLNHGAFSGGIVEKLVLNNTRFYNIDDAFVLRNHSNILTSVFHPELLDELELRRKGAFENNQISFDIGGERGVSSPSSPSCSFDANGAPAAGSKCGEESSLSCSNSDDLCVLTSNNNTHSNGVFSIRTANNMCVKITSIVLIALSIKKSFIYYNLRMVIHI